MDISSTLVICGNEGSLIRWDRMYWKASFWSEIFSFSSFWSLQMRVPERVYLRVAGGDVRPEI